MKKQIVKFLVAALIFGVCYTAKTAQIPQHEWINNQVQYIMKHNSDIKTITQNTIQNAKLLFDSAMEKIKS